LAWQPARVPAIRFAAALSASDGSARIKFFEKVAEFAGLSGARVWIADHRGDRRGGIWLDVLDGSAGDYKLWVKHKLGGADPLIKWVLPVTFVGPARVGSTYEVVNFLAASKVPIVSATIGSLKDLAFIQLGLGSAEQFAWSPEDGMSAAMMLREIAEKLGRTGAGAPDLDRARGYTVCRGVAVPYKPHPPRETAHSMWAAWQVPHRRDALAVVIRTLRTALGAALRSAGIDGNVADQFVADTNIEYAVCRRVETGEVRGRCKLAVPGDVPDKMATPQDRQDRQLTELCRLVEHRWRTALAIELQSSAVEAEFSWRERFLGRWSTLLAGSMS
jgi:hypothetical protein